MLTRRLRDLFCHTLSGSLAHTAHRQGFELRDSQVSQLTGLQLALQNADFARLRTAARRWERGTATSGAHARGGA